MALSILDDVPMEERPEFNKCVQLMKESDRYVCITVKNDEHKWHLMNMSTNEIIMAIEMLKFHLLSKNE